jgi:ABC-type sulfate transport system permease component
MAPYHSTAAPGERHGRHISGPAHISATPRGARLARATAPPSFGAAMILADVPNYTHTKPIMQSTESAL